MVLISDGRGNISYGGEEPLLEAQRLADQIRRVGIRALVIDSSRDHLTHHRPPGRAGPELHAAPATTSTLALTSPSAWGRPTLVSSTSPRERSFDPSPRLCVSPSPPGRSSSL